MFFLQTEKYSGISFAVGLCIVATMLVIVVKGYAARKSRYNRPGSVADLVRRGQLRSDRRGMYGSNINSVSSRHATLMTDSCDVLV